MLSLLMSLFAFMGVGAAASGSAPRTMAATVPQNEPADDAQSDMSGHGAPHTPPGHDTEGHMDGHGTTHTGTMDTGHGGDNHDTTGDTGTAGHGTMDHDVDTGGAATGHETTGHGDGHDTGGHGGMGHGGHDIVLPTTPADIEAFVQAVKSAPDIHVHDSDSPMLGEHMAALALVPTAEATHIAIGNGDWSDPNNWYNGEIPGDNAKVVIPDGVTMTYDVDSAARLFTVRVDGELTFATDTTTSMIVDTFVVSPKGTLTIGTEDDPIQPDVSTDIIIANNGPIDTNWDPMLLSRGLISHGEATFHGAVKDSHEKVIEDPMAGDTSITFEEIPVGWQVGDTIVIAGTDYDGYNKDPSTGERRHFEPEDEIREITSIDGNTVHFNDALIHDHDTPRDDLFTSVANYSRNITIGTEDPDTAEVYERGHAMFMHSDDVDVRYAAFHELGRTDKSEAAHDADEVQNLTFDTNVKGRYGLHLHRTGTDDVDDPAVVIGNAVYGSPGWGFVHHDSNAILDNNASYNTFGAGFVAESGNEIGTWSDNIAIYAQGNNWNLVKNAQDPEAFDTGRSGDGFWFQSRMVDSVDNIAASVNHGFVYYHRGELADDAQLAFDADVFLFPGAMSYVNEVKPEDAPILSFEGNEAFAAKEGLHVVKANTQQNHDVHSIFEDFTAWNVKNGAHFEYTAHYVIKDFDLIAREATQINSPDTGLSFGRNTSDMTIVDTHVDGFQIGYDLLKDFTDPNFSKTDHEYTLINATGSNISKLFYKNYDATYDTILDSSDIVDPGVTPFVELSTPLTYREGSGPGDRTVVLEGSKTDSLGVTDFPGGVDDYDLGIKSVLSILNTKGYYAASDGNNYFTFDLYFSDRLTGDIYKQTELVRIDDNVPLTHTTNQYKDVIYNGEIDITDLQAMVKGSELVASGDNVRALVQPTPEPEIHVQPTPSPEDEANVQRPPTEEEDSQSSSEETTITMDAGRLAPPKEHLDEADENTPADQYAALKASDEISVQLPPKADDLDPPVCEVETTPHTETTDPEVLWTALTENSAILTETDLCQDAEDENILELI